MGVVDADGHVHLRNIVLGRDFGDYVEVLAGLAATDQVVVNPPDSISDGMSVKMSAPADSASAK